MAWITGRQTVKHPNPFPSLFCIFFLPPTSSKTDELGLFLPYKNSLYFLWLLLFIKIAQFRWRLLVYAFLPGFGSLYRWHPSWNPRAEIFHANKWYFCWQLPPSSILDGCKNGKKTFTPNMLGWKRSRQRRQSGLSGLFILLHIQKHIHPLPTSKNLGLKLPLVCLKKIMPKIMQCHVCGPTKKYLKIVANLAEFSML